jgi:alkylation response protein AidB-like acyl-CoA dehydrogenase
VARVERIGQRLMIDDPGAAIMDAAWPKIADAFMRPQLGPQLDAATREWSDGVDRADWPIKIVAAKYRAVEGAWRIVDRAMDLSGGFGMFKKSELERLFRDARAGRFHPANSLLSHELIGKLTLGINPDEQPRWG